MSLSIRASGLNAYALELLSPTQPEFDAIARPLIGERIADAALRLKPMLVIVSNENVQTVVSLSLVWHVVQRDTAGAAHERHRCCANIQLGPDRVADSSRG